MEDHFLSEGPLIPGNAVVAIITSETGEYLCQNRDQKKGIFFPDHWGLFGGGVESGESPEEAIVREIKEELDLDLENFSFFTEFTFDFSYNGYGILWRKYYSAEIKKEKIPKLKLGEGREFGLFSAQTILTKPRLVPYDSFAIWMHNTRNFS